MDLSLDQIKMSVRARSCCRLSGINTISELRKFAEERDVIRMRGCGKLTARELRNILKENEENANGDVVVDFNNLANLDGIINSLSVVKKLLIGLALDKWLRLPNDAQPIDTPRLRGLSLETVLSIAESMCGIVNKEIIDEYSATFPNFKHEIEEIIAISETQAQIQIFGNEALNLYKKFPRVTKGEETQALIIGLANGRLPLFRLLFLNYASSDVRNEKIFVDRLGLFSNPDEYAALAERHSLTRQRISQIVIREHRKARRYKKYFAAAYPFWAQIAIPLEETLISINDTEFKDREGLSSLSFEKICNIIDDFWTLEINHKHYLVHKDAISEKAFSCCLARLKKLAQTPRDCAQEYPLESLMEIDTHNYQTDKLIELLQTVIPNLEFDGNNIILRQTRFNGQTEKDASLPPRDGKRRLQIMRPDNTIIEVGNSNLTFRDFVKEVGWERVKALEISFDGEELFQKTKTNNWYKEIAPGWYLFTKMTCAKKIEIISQICKSLAVDYRPSMTTPM